MIDQFKTRFGEVTAGFSGSQKAMMGVVFVAIIGGLWVFSSWASTTDMAPLYADLETADAAAVVDELTSKGVDYELTDQGRTVLVPRDEVYELRLNLSTEGLPNGGSQGYALLDNQGITATQFQQRVAYQRALEGELAATIRHIESIDAASVHLVMPEDDLFSGDDIHATASVLVETAQTLAPDQVQAIVNLVAGSVEGLRADAVTVADQSGLVLAAPGQTPFDRAGVSGVANQTRVFEQQLAADITAMLTAVVGPGNAMVTVSAEMDWDASSTVSETHTPSDVAEGADPLTSTETTRSESYTTNSSDGDGGALGEGEDSTEATSDSTYNSSDASRDFVFDSTVRTIENQGGDIVKLNVAVLLDEGSSTEAQLTEIQSLVTSAAGVDVARGDTLAVSRLAFDKTIEEALAADTSVASPAAEPAGGMLPTIVLAALGFVIIVIAAIQLWRGRSGSEEVEELDLATLTNSLTAGAARPIMPAQVGQPVEVSATAAAAAAANASPEDELRGLVDSQPDEVARLLRTWLADRRAVAR